MQQWEYATIRRTRTIHGDEVESWSIEPIEPTLEALEQEGWEMIGQVPQSNQVAPENADLVLEEVWIFKRLVPTL